MGWQTVIATIFQAGNRIVINPSGLFIYNGTPAFGNLVGYWTTKAGTDKFGNTYIQALSVGSPTSSTPQVQIIPSAGGPNSQAAIQFTLSPLTFFSNQPNIQALSPSSKGELIISGPGLQQSGFQDFVQELYSSYAGIIPAQMQGNYRDIAGTFHTYLLLTCSGVTISAGSIRAVFPGTGTAGTPAVPEVWHNLPLAAGWSTLANYPPPSYKLKPDGAIAVAGLATHAAFAANILLSASPVGSPYVPVNNQFVPAAEPGSAGLLVDQSGNWTATTGVNTGTVNFTGEYFTDI